MRNNIIINIGRQLGSGGREIGKMLARDLNIRFLDKELICLAAERSGLCQEFFEKADEKPNRAFSSIFTMRFPFINESCIPGYNCLSNDALFKVQSDVIRELAEQEPCLFVGRCADYVLRDNPNCINIFISAPKEVRIKRIMELNSLTAEKAEELIEKTDDKRAEYYNYYSSKTWGSAASYHLCIDSSILGLNKTEEMILEFIKITIGNRQKK